MSVKKEINKSTIDDYVHRFNNSELTREQIIKELGISSRTWTARVSESGYKYNLQSKKYDVEEEQIPGQLTMTDNEVNIAAEQSLKVPAVNLEENNIDKKSVGRPQIHQPGELMKRTFIITPAIDKAIRLKAANECKNVNEVVREIFNKNIEEKYFKGL